MSEQSAELREAKYRALIETLQTKVLEAKINCDGSGESVAYTQGVIDTHRACRDAIVQAGRTVTPTPEEQHQVEREGE